MPRSERLDEALAIPGWMFEAELAWLEEQALERTIIVEIGSWQGRSTKALAATPGTVYAVDDWRGENDDPVEDLGALFAGHLADEIARHKVIVIEQSSLDAAKEWREA